MAFPACRRCKSKPHAFKDIQPGVTTADELVQRWGEGTLLQAKDGTQTRASISRTFTRASRFPSKRKRFPPSTRIRPTDRDGALAERLHLDPDSSVPVLDDRVSRWDNRIPTAAVVQLRSGHETGLADASGIHRSAAVSCPSDYRGGIASRAGACGMSIMRSARPEARGDRTTSARPNADCQSAAPAKR